MPIQTSYIPKITKSAGDSFYALIVRVDYDGEENVIHGYAGRYFKTEKAALRSTERYMAKHELN